MAILGYINLAEKLSASDEQKALLAGAEKASLRAKGLTQQLLTFAKGGEPVTETACISEIIVESAEFVLHGSNVAADFIIPEDISLVVIDKGQISQVIQNIVINARNAMPAGGVITISCINNEINTSDIIPLTPGKYVEITISDTGVGIPTADLEKIFDPYFTTSESGHGLGLAVTGSIISKHKGYIRVESIEGTGTTFTILLPASPDKEAMPRIEEKAANTGTGTVLIMDDDKILLDVGAMMLSHLGYKAILCEDGKEMLEIYKQAILGKQPIDLVIMDLTIPGGMGGKKAISKLLEIDPDAVAIVASGYSNDPVMANFQNYGFKAALCKPFQLGELAAVVSTLLRLA
jgi:CheY-like chemotaxis protein